MTSRSKGKMDLSSQAGRRKRLTDQKEIKMPQPSLFLFYILYSPKTVDINLRKSFFRYNQLMLEQGNRHYANSDYPKAIDCYTSGLKNRPSQEEEKRMLLNIGLAYVQDKQYIKAIQYFQKVLDIDPDFRNREAYYELGQALQILNRLQESTKAYLNYLQRCPDHPQCNFNLGLAYFHLKDYAAAHTYFSKASIFNPQYTQAHKMKIQLLLKQNRYEQVIQISNKVLQYDPKAYNFYYYRGFSYLRNNKLQQAVQSLEQAMQPGRRQIPVYIALAEALYRSGDNSGIHLLEGCLKDNKLPLKDKQIQKINYWSGVFKMRLKEYRQAAQFFKAVLSQRPVIEGAKGKLAECLEQEGNSYFEKKNYSDALRCYMEALGYDYERTTLLNNTGLVYQHIGNFAEAENYYKKVLSIDCCDVIAQNNMAIIEDERGNKAKAAEIMQKVARENPQNYVAHFNNGKRLISQCKYKQALEEFQKAEGLKTKEDPCLYNDMAVALEYQERYEEALNYALKANSITGESFPLFLVNRACILMRLGRKDEAIRDLNRSKKSMAESSKEKRLWDNNENRVFIEKQLKRYGSLMEPIEDFKEQLVRENITIMTHQLLQSQAEKVLQGFKNNLAMIGNAVLQYTISEMKKVNEASRSQQDINQQMKSFYQKKIQKLHQQFEAFKSECYRQFQTKNVAKQAYLKKINQLRNQKDLPLYKYAKQFYWFLYLYLQGYVLARGGVVGKGENIDRSALNSAIKKFGDVMEYAESIPVVGDFSQIISKICGFFVDMEDEVIIQKMHELISFNYTVVGELEDQICETVVMFMNHAVKTSKIRNLIDNINAEPEGLFQRFKKFFSDIGEWLQDKKNSFFMGLRGYEKPEQIIQENLAIIDVGLIISVMLKMKGSSSEKRPVLTEAANWVLEDSRMEDMLAEAPQKKEKSEKVPSQSSKKEEGKSGQVANQPESDSCNLI